VCPEAAQLAWAAAQEPQSQPTQEPQSQPTQVGSGESGAVAGSTSLEDDFIMTLPPPLLQNCGRRGNGVCPEAAQLAWAAAQEPQSQPTQEPQSQPTQEPQSQPTQEPQSQRSGRGRTARDRVGKRT